MGMYDTKDALLSMLYRGETKAVTPYHVTMDGNLLNEGIYICVLRTNENIQRQKMIVTK